MKPATALLGHWQGEVGAGACLIDFHHTVDHELGVVGGKMPSALLSDVAERVVEELLLGVACECGEDDETGVDGVGFAESAEVAVVVCDERSILLDAACQDLDIRASEESSDAVAGGIEAVAMRDFNQGR